MTNERLLEIEYEAKMYQRKHVRAQWGSAIVLGLINHIKELREQLDKYEKHDKMLVETNRMVDLKL